MLRDLGPLLDSPLGIASTAVPPTSTTGGESALAQTHTHGIREFHANQTQEDFAAEQLRTLGYAIIESDLTAEEIDDLRERLDVIYQKQVDEIGGEDRLRAMKDANVARAPLVYDDKFLRLATYEHVLRIAERLLGDYFILMLQNGVIAHPDQGFRTVPWHRDLNWQHFVSSRPLALSAFWAIDDFTVETGGTGLLPATHKIEEFPSDEFCARHEITATMPAGSVLIFDSMVYHRSGQNTSDRIRRGVNHMYSLPLLKQQLSFPQMLGGKYSDDPKLGKLLGYGSESGENVRLWRESKLSLIDA